MPQHYRHYWGNQIANQFNFEWDAIQHDSYVVITAAEGPAPGSSDFPPERFVGNASLVVGSIAPHTGGVTFWIFYLDGTQEGAWWMGSYYQYDGGLSLWTDITVFDPGDPAGTN
jgi:hypothetical protein